MATPRLKSEQKPSSGFLSEKAKKEIWRLGIASYAKWASMGRRPWYPYAWLLKIAQIIRFAIVVGGARYIINAPPRHGKSEFCSHWLPTWFLDLWPEKQVMLTSYGGDFAAEWGRKVRDEFIMNEFTWTNLRADSKAVATWQTPEGGGMTCAGVGGPITGRGADLVIIDDPHKNWEEAMSPTARERVIDWFNSTLYTRLEPDASIIVIQTRWHEDDLTGYLLDRHDDDWELLRFPALAEDDEDLLARAEGEALCPERYSAERLEEIKKIGSYIFAGLYQQRPAPLLGGIVKRPWFKYWTEMPEQIDEWFQVWDLTFKATGTSFVVGETWARSGANAYLVDQIRDKMDFLEQVRQIKVMAKRWPKAATKLIEDAADAQAVKATLDDAVPGIILVPAKGSKEARLAAVAGVIESGNVYLPEGAEWLDDYLTEVTTFPGTVNDDQVDATTMALDRLIQSTYDTDISLPSVGQRDNPWSFAHGITK
jgi:predicted phage terminase large subunit-like protein